MLFNYFGVVKMPYYIEPNRMFVQLEILQVNHRIITHSKIFSHLFLGIVK